MKKSNRNVTEINYWESMADSMIALLLCILLVMLLLMLYLVRIDDNPNKDKDLGYSYEQYNDPDDGGGNHSYGAVDNAYGNSYIHEDHRYDDGGDGGGDDGGGDDGGGDYGGGIGTDFFPYEDPDPGAGEGEGMDRAAVLVQVLDGETDRTIKKEGIIFELYDRDDVLKVLNTYYPKKVSYKQYRTESTGVFFLPERIKLDKYYLHCLSTVPGYDTGEDTYFEIDQSYDWEDPYVLNIKLYPSKNVIEVRLKDIANGKGIANAVFQVIAAENIITSDGTLRHQENDVVDNIVVGSDGVGRSKELYLGNYVLQQSTIPEYYGKVDSEYAVTLKARTTAKKQEIADIYEEKTSADITVVDELYQTKPLSGVSFSLLSSDGKLVQQYTTNDQGRFTINSLKKNTTYRVQQISSAEGYQTAAEDLIFQVDGDGYINGAVNAALKIQNRTLRLAVSLQDKLFRSPVSDVNMALMDSEGNIIKSWNSSGMDQIIEGLSVGEYKIIAGGDQKNASVIVIEDTAELQSFRLQRWTTSDIATLIAAAAIGISLIAVFGWLWKIKKRK